MPISSDLKKAQRILSVTLRAIERCFSNAVINSAKCEFDNSLFILVLHVDLNEEFDLLIDIEQSTVSESIKLYLAEIEGCLNEMISILEKNEEEIKIDIANLGESFTDSSLNELSSALMLLQVIKSVS